MKWKSQFGNEERNKNENSVINMSIGPSESKDRHMSNTEIEVLLTVPLQCEKEKQEVTLMCLSLCMTQKLQSPAFHKCPITVINQVILLKADHVQ